MQIPVVPFPRFPPGGASPFSPSLSFSSVGARPNKLLSLEPPRRAAARRMNKLCSRNTGLATAAGRGTRCSLGLAVSLPSSSSFFLSFLLPPLPPHPRISAGCSSPFPFLFFSLSSLVLSVASRAHLSLASINGPPRSRFSPRDPYYAREPKRARNFFGAGDRANIK